MIITDHINLLPNPLIGPNDDRIGARFPDMGEAYDKYLINKASVIAADLKFRIHKGVYLSTSGPTFETPAEYRYFRIIGADAVGMSTTPEVIVARHMNLPVFAVSIITDLGVEGKIGYTTHQSVLEEAAKTEDRMTLLMTEMISTL
jgi:purine-nucleoside phosphorylase